MKWAFHAFLRILGIGALVAGGRQWSRRDLVIVLLGPLVFWIAWNVLDFGPALGLPELGFWGIVLAALFLVVGWLGKVLITASFSWSTRLGSRARRMHRPSRLPQLRGRCAARNCSRPGLTPREETALQHLGVLGEITAVSPGRAARPDPASSVASVGTTTKAPLVLGSERLTGAPDDERHSRKSLLPRRPCSSLLRRPPTAPAVPRTKTAAVSSPATRRPCRCRGRRAMAGAPWRERQSPRPRVARFMTLCAPAGPDREADEVAALERSLRRREAHGRAFHGDEQPLLVVLVVIGTSLDPGGGRRRT